MKIAVLSDIHGNIWALEAVFQDIQKRNVDHLINLGDIFYGPLEPRLTYERLKKIPVVTILGNQDRVMIEARKYQSQANATLAYGMDNLGEEPLNWLTGFPTTTHFQEEFLLCHGAPHNDTVYLLEDISQGFAWVKEEEIILNELSGVAASIILCGHSHTPRVVRLSNGVLIINPGSVGLPAYNDDSPHFHIMQTCSPFASYALLEKQGTEWSVEEIKVAYDFSSAVKCAEDHGRLDWAGWLYNGRAD